MRMLEESGNVAADDIAYVLIFVDGERDSPAVMKAFLD
jgi:cytochrome oxidase Cu insertion factor (SCO1/SenC/PrrC family)